MKTVRKVIRVVVCVAIIFSSVAPSLTFAQESPQPLSFRSQADLDRILARLPESLANFYRTPEAQQALRRALDGELVDKKVVEFGRNWFSSSLKSFITGFVLIGAAEVRHRAHDRNLQLSPDNVKQLSEEVNQDWTVFRQTEFSTADATLMFAPSQGLNYVTAKAVQTIVTSERMGNVLKSFISGSVLSIGLNYINDLVQVATRFVIDNNDHFGGLNQKELTSLKILQLRTGITYYFNGLVRGGPNTKSAYKKVFKAMQIMLFHDPILRETLWSHMTREALLKGDNVTIIGLSIISTIIRDALLPESALKKMGTLEKNAKTVGFSIAFALIGSELVPDWLEAEETYLMRSGYARFKLHGEEKDAGELYRSITRLPENNRLDSLNQYLAQRRHLREYALVMYASVAKLALDRVDSLVFEQKNLIRIHDQLEAKHAQQSFVGHMAGIPKELLYSLAGGDILPYSLKIKEENRLINFYKDLFNRAAANTLAIYSAAENEMDGLIRTFGDTAPGPLLAEKAGVANMHLFLSYFFSLLPQKWYVENPTPEFWASRQSLDQISFWGLRESDILKQGTNVQTP